MAEIPGLVIDYKPAWYSVNPPGDVWTRLTGLTIGLAASAPAPDRDGLHLWASNASQTAISETLFTIERNGNAFVSFLTSPTTSGGFYFADSGNTNDGYMLYSQNARAFTFGTATALSATLSGGGSPTLAFAGATTISTSTGALTLAPTGGSLLFTGTLAVTGSRVTQSYHTNITSTNAVTVDSSETVKHDISPYQGDALALIRDMNVITYKHEEWLDASQETKLGVRAESVHEPLALNMIEREDGDYPGITSMA